MTHPGAPAQPHTAGAATETADEYGMGGGELKIPSHFSRDRGRATSRANAECTGEQCCGRSGGCEGNLVEFINIPDETVDVMHAKWVLEEMR